MLLHQCTIHAVVHLRQHIYKRCIKGDKYFHMRVRTSNPSL